MFIKDWKKRLAALSLASIMTLNTTGCGNSDTDTKNTESTSTIEAEKTCRTEELFIIHLDGNYHLTTCIHKNDDREYDEYYDVNTGECVGHVLTKYYYTSETQKEKNILKRDIAFLDYKDIEGFAGYSYGNIIPDTAVTPLTLLTDAQAISQSEYEFLSSNSKELKDYLDSYLTFNEFSRKDYIYGTAGFFGFAFTEINKWAYKTVPLSKFICKNPEGKSDIFIGYRCSCYPSDIGYNYVYDVITGYMIYIGSLDNEAYVEVTEETIDNSALLPLCELEDQYKTVDASNDNSNPEPAESNPVTTDEPVASEPGTELSDEPVASEPSSLAETMEASSLYILDTTRIKATDEFDYNYTYGDVERFYFLKDTGENLKLDTFEIDLYEDLYNKAEANSSDSFRVFNYVDSEKTIIINFVQENTPIIGINAYLESIGREDLIRETYTLSDIDKIRKVITVSPKTMVLK